MGNKIPANSVLVFTMELRNCDGVASTAEDEKEGKVATVGGGGVMELSTGMKVLIGMFGLVMVMCACKPKAQPHSGLQRRSVHGGG